MKPYRQPDEHDDEELLQSDAAHVDMYRAAQLLWAGHWPRSDAADKLHYKSNEIEGDKDRGQNVGGDAKQGARRGPVRVHEVGEEDIGEGVGPCLSPCISLMFLLFPRDCWIGLLTQRCQQNKNLRHQKQPARTLRLCARRAEPEAEELPRARHDDDPAPLLPRVPKKGLPYVDDREDGEEYSGDQGGDERRVVVVQRTACAWRQVPVGVGGDGPDAGGDHNVDCPVGHGCVRACEACDCDVLG